MNSKPLYIFDLDGTLADLKHRRHLVERPFTASCPDCGGISVHAPRCMGDIPKFKPNWDAFHAACVDDIPIWPVIETLKRLGAQADIWVWSGRMNTVLNESIRWFERYDLLDRIDDFKMRLAGDYTPDDTLKEQWLNELPTTDRMRLTAVFDDRDRVVAMWRRNGVQCFQAAPGNF